MSEPFDPRPGDHGEWDALAVGWALSALEPHDEARFAVHLPTCRRCTATVRETLRTVSDLAYAVPDEAPPAGLKQRVMAAAAAEPRTAQSPPATSVPSADGAARAGHAGPRSTGHAATDPTDPRGTGSIEAGSSGTGPAGTGPAAGGSAAGGSAAGGSAAGGSAAGGSAAGGSAGAGVPGPRHATPAPGDRDGRGGEVVPLRPARTRRWTAVVASAAAIVLIAALGAWNLQLRSDRDDLRSVVAQREAAIARLTADGPAKVAAVQAVNAQLQPQPTRRATIVVKDGRTTIIVEDLSPRVGRDSYWLWTLDCVGAVGNLKPIQGFQVRSDGFSLQNVGSQPGLATTQCFAISAEAIQGTPTQPGTVVAVGQLR